ncbi:hypothetical protein SARC_00301 [Sphaeroforma arctica JP610]|uniref:Uncharacterized protein n=1 Tax=Sphaeroforma arctica JP610 TaxID=667725 RepID=A0A0L0GFJ3_9EUKA|nr:hypothetical protein SARC_00301 [Sphaeroforma arctica JP610]KNC87601.1 hypothetical protein SARC_00301 [Sphaeroforma arctica JP610]|eukprot:XP_014161503.1 hypothetical protein SARC_00301 [Sphaeroforma arctica JP610]
MGCIPYQKQLIKCVRAGNLAQLQSRMESFDDVNAHDTSGATLLHHALRRGYLDIAHYLCEHGCNIEARDDNGRHPLHEVASHGIKGGVELLVLYGCEIDPLKHADWTPLMIACTTTHFAVIQALVEAGANLQLYNKDGWTPLHLACRVGDVDIVSYLMDKRQDEDVDLWNRAAHNGRTPIHTTAAHGHVRVLEILFDACRQVGYDLTSIVNIQDSSGNTPLMCAVTSRSIKAVDFICRKHEGIVSLGARDKNGRQALHVACLINAPEITRLLLKHSADVNARDNKSISPLQLAAREGHVEILEVLTDTSLCDLAAKDCYDQTAADDALKFGKMDAFEYLKSRPENVPEN